MHFQLNYTIARRRSAELQRAGERARLAREVPAKRRKLRDTDPITRLSTKPQGARDVEGTLRGLR